VNINNGVLISFDESGFTGPQLLNEDQPFFVYASHDLDGEDSALLIKLLRSEFRLQGAELKAQRLKKRADWEAIAKVICEATRRRANVVTHEKRTALCGKFFEYFFEPVLADYSTAFYQVGFHKYIMNTMSQLLPSQPLDDRTIASQMQAFMRSFEPDDAPNIFAAKDDEFPIEIQRILAFCSGYASVIHEKTGHLKPGGPLSGKWTLDLTSTSLFSSLFHFWGHKHPRLEVLCDESKPLAEVAPFFNGWVGQDQAIAITNGRSEVELKGNLVAPIHLGRSENHSSLQLADLLAGMTNDVCIRGNEAPSVARDWVRQHTIHSHSVGFEPEFTQKGNSVVRVGREILKELSKRASTGADPLDGIVRYIDRLATQYGLQTSMY